MGKVLGLDLGIASVGFALVDFDSREIVAIGSHIFNAAEQPYTGASLAEPRRKARSQRRRLARRRRRLDRVARLLTSHGLGDVVQLAAGLRSRTPSKDPWQLRAEALERKLWDDEFARVLLHIAKRRGFHSNRKKPAAGEEVKEAGKMLSGVENLRTAMTESGARTIGQYLAGLEKRRNEPLSYDKTVLRDLLRRETAVIFESQRSLGNPRASAALEAEFIEAAFTQRPLKSSLHLVGRCQLEPDELRAPRRAWSAELFVARSRLLSLKIVHLNGTERELSSTERDRLLERAHKFKTGVTFAQARQKLGLADRERFNLAVYRKTSVEDQTWEEIRKRAEKAKLIVLDGYHQIKAALAPLGESVFRRLAAERANLDAIAFAFSFFHDEQEIHEHLTGVPLEPEEVDSLLAGLDFSGTIHLSLKAVNNLLPYLERGLRYDQACEAAGYHHSSTPTGRLDRLPPVPPTRNPVVDRAMAQTRKIINAVIRRHGMPDRFHIEFARDMAQSKKKRGDAQRENEKFRRKKETLRVEAAGVLGRKPSANEFMKYRLWKEQHGFCLYSGGYISPEMLADPLACQIDHALPRSRSWDNSYSNQVLCLAGENQAKGDKTPFEYLEPLGRWDEFLALAKALPFHRRRKIMRKDFIGRHAEEWRQRNLNDTRYMARALKSHLEESLRPNRPGELLVRTVNGSMTSLLRGMWRLGRKFRDDDRHHAMDALIVACATQSMVQRVNNWHRYQRDGQLRPGFELDKPWPDTFRADALAAVESVFVCRRQVGKATGSIHKDTILSGRRDGEGVMRYVKRVRMEDLTLNMLDNLVDVSVEEGEVTGRNRRLYRVLRERLEAHGGKAKKAFAQPIHMPTNTPGVPGPVIRTVRVETNDKSLFRVPGREGYAANDSDSMVRVDVFACGGQFHLRPVYVRDLMGGRIPDHYCLRGAPMEDWPGLTDGHRFLFSLRRNDYVRVEKGDGSSKEGYYRKMDISNTSISLRLPSGQEGPAGVGITTAKAVRKFRVNYFGELSEVKQERLHGLADAADSE